MANNGKKRVPQLPEQTNPNLNAYILYDDGSVTYKVTLANLTKIVGTGIGAITGGTYDRYTGITTLTNNTGGTFTISGYFKPADDVYVNNLIFDTSNYDLTVTRNDGWSNTENLGILAGDLRVTGGTYNSNTGVGTFTNNSGGTFNVSGFLTGYTDTIITAFTYNNNTFTISDSKGSVFNATMNTMTGLTINGNLIVNGTNNLPIPTLQQVTNSGNSTTNDIYVGSLYTQPPTGFVHTSSIHTNTNLKLIDVDDITKWTFEMSGVANAITFHLDNVTDSRLVYWPDKSGTVAFLDDLSGATASSALTYNNNTVTLVDQSGRTFSTVINVMTGLTVNGELYADYISGCTLENGANLTTPGACSHAEGNWSTAVGNYSHAEGLSTVAIGGASHTEGELTKTLANYSHAEGYNTTALGIYSHTEGNETISSGSCQTVVS